jgi:hypothetical protein
MDIYGPWQKIIKISFIDNQPLAPIGTALHKTRGSQRTCPAIAWATAEEGSE